MSSTSNSAPPRARSALLLLLALVAAAGAASWLGIAQGGWIDDSFISFRYARHLVEGHGLVYNVGDPVEGYSNFLWALIASLGIALGVEPIHFTQGVSLLAQAATLWMLYEIGRTGGHRGARPLIAPLFLAGSVAFLEYPMTGMETSFFTMLLTLCFLLLRRRGWGTVGGAFALGGALLALSTTRFDGFVPAILLLSYPILFERPLRADGTRRRPSLGRPLLILGLGLAAYDLWRIGFYPTLLPNTFHAKTSFSLPRVWIGLRHLSTFVLGVGALPVLLGLAPFLLRRASPLARALGWVVLGQAGYVAVVGGDWMPHHRFLFPVLPLLCASMQEGCLALAPRMPLPRAVRVGLLAVAFALYAVPAGRRLALDEAPTGSHFQPHDARRIGEYLAEHYPSDRFLAVEWGGIVPYYVPHRCLDTWGLTDRHIVQQGFRRMVWGRHITPRYLSLRKPDLIVSNARLLPTEEEARASVLPGGVNDYSHYPRMASPEFGYRWEIFRLAGDAWWPALVRIQ